MTKISAAGYLDFKDILYGNNYSQPLDISIHIQRKGKVADLLCCCMYNDSNSVGVVVIHLRCAFYPPETAFRFSRKLGGVGTTAVLIQ